MSASLSVKGFERGHIPGEGLKPVEGTFGVWVYQNGLSGSTQIFLKVFERVQGKKTQFVICPAKRTNLKRARKYLEGGGVVRSFKDAGPQRDLVQIQQWKSGIISMVKAQTVADAAKMKARIDAVKSFFSGIKKGLVSKESPLEKALYILIGLLIVCLILALVIL